MATTAEGGDRIIISALDIRVLLALLLGPMGGYEIARQCEKDTESEQTISNGTLYPALKSLKDCYLIEVVGGNNLRPGKESKIYKITSIGEMVLSWKIESFKVMIGLANDRSLPKD